MRQAQDIVWNVIAESAKRRFDYIAFKKSLGERGDDERTAEYILFLVIVGFAEELPHEEFISTLQSDLHLFGYLMSEEEIGVFLTGKQKVLSEEISAAKDALEQFANGCDISTIFGQVQARLECAHALQ